MMYSSAVALTTLALSMTRSAAFFGSGRPDFGAISGKITPKGTSTDGSFSSGPVKTTVSGFSACASKAWSQSITAHKDSYINAVAEAVVNVCDMDPDTDKVVNPMKDWAGAYADAAALAIGGCITGTSSDVGTVQGCTYAAADAEAMADALATIHITATAEAFATHCTCTNAESWSFSTADAIVKIFAEATADAEILACAEGNQISGAVAKSKCWAKITAESFALAVAKAAAAAGCWDHPDGDADAATLTLAKFKFEFEEEKECDIFSDEYGNAAGHAGGDADTSYDFEVRPCKPPAE